MRKNSDANWAREGMVWKGDICRHDGQLPDGYNPHYTPVLVGLLP